LTVFDYTYLRITVDWVAVKKVTQEEVGAWRSCPRDAGSRNLEFLKILIFLNVVNAT
jgi:hypothetical protein